MEKTIYSINEEYLRLMAEIEENEGEMTPELEQALSINEADHAAKLEAYGQIIANYKGEAMRLVDGPLKNGTITELSINKILPS